LHSARWGDKLNAPYGYGTLSEYQRAVYREYIEAAPNQERQLSLASIAAVIGCSTRSARTFSDNAGIETVKLPLLEQQQSIHAARQIVEYCLTHRVSPLDRTVKGQAVEIRIGDTIYAIDRMVYGQDGFAFRRSAERAARAIDAAIREGVATVTVAYRLTDLRRVATPELPPPERKRRTMAESKSHSVVAIADVSMLESSPDDLPKQVENLECAPSSIPSSVSDVVICTPMSVSVSRLSFAQRWENACWETVDRWVYMIGWQVFNGGHELLNASTGEIIRYTRSNMVNILCGKNPNAWPLLDRVGCDDEEVLLAIDRLDTDSQQPILDEWPELKVQYMNYLKRRAAFRRGQLLQGKFV